MPNLKWELKLDADNGEWTLGGISFVGKPETLRATHGLNLRYALEKDDASFQGRILHSACGHLVLGQADKGLPKALLSAVLGGAEPVAVSERPDVQAGLTGKKVTDKTKVFVGRCPGCEHTVAVVANEDAEGLYQLLALTAPEAAKVEAAG